MEEGFRTASDLELFIIMNEISDEWKRACVVLLIYPKTVEIT